MLDSVSTCPFDRAALAPLRAVWGDLVATPSPGRLCIGPVDVTDSLCRGFDMQQSVGLIYEFLEDSGGAGYILARLAADDRVAALLAELARRLGPRSDERHRRDLDRLLCADRYSDRDVDAVVAALR